MTTTEEKGPENKSSFTILDPARVTAKDIIAIWRAELEKAVAAEAAAGGSSGKKV